MQMDGMRLAQAYVPPQRFEALFSPQQALCAGTIFEQLEMPYKKKK
ncbi:MAG: spore coat associated protein CotJA [Clostridia bacterium]|nr:spore coat associated protein CotJA [Clostridia bacterium]